jgi:hypothetical protein
MRLISLGMPAGLLSALPRCPGHSDLELRPRVLFRAPGTYTQNAASDDYQAIRSTSATALRQPPRRSANPIQQLSRS